MGSLKIFLGGVTPDLQGKSMEHFVFLFFFFLGILFPLNLTQEHFWVPQRDSCPGFALTSHWSATHQCASKSKYGQSLPGGESVTVRSKTGGRRFRNPLCWDPNWAVCWRQLHQAGWHHRESELLGNGNFFTVAHFHLLYIQNPLTLSYQEKATPSALVILRTAPFHFFNKKGIL